MDFPLCFDTVCIIKYVHICKESKKKEKKLTLILLSESYQETCFQHGNNFV